MSIKRSGLISIGLLLLFSTTCGPQPERPDRVELFRHPGLLWLSWSPGQRENFVLGYLQGYGHGVVEACRAADDLFDKGKPRLIGHDGVPSTFPSARCRASVATYSNFKIDLAKGPHLGAYTTPITEFYTNHPEYRDFEFTLLMEYMSGAKSVTANDLYGRVTGWESAPPK